MALSGTQYQELTNAFLSAFPTEATLRRMVLFKLEHNLEAIAGGNNLTDRVVNLIQVAESEGWTDKLIVGARAFNPGNLKLEAFAVDYGLASVGQEEAGELEVMLRKEMRFKDFRSWLADWARQEPRVCRVELPLYGQEATVCGHGLGCGTGFLVGRDLLLTAFHVIEPLVKWEEKKAAGQAWANPADARLRFDYAQREGEPAIYEGTVFKLAAPWQVIAQPVGAADFQSHKTPSPADLDFALVRVAGAPGDQAVGGNGGPGTPKRGWIPLPPQPLWPEKDAPLFILQHPAGEPLKMAPPDRVLELNANKTRVRYLVNTKAGSSGSPCFNAQLQLVALHHFGREEKYNQGVPIAAIAPLIAPYLQK